MGFVAIRGTVYLRPTWREGREGSQRHREPEYRDGKGFSLHLSLLPCFLYFSRTHPRHLPRGNIEHNSRVFLGSPVVFSFLFLRTVYLLSRKQGTHVIAIWQRLESSKYHSAPSKTRSFALRPDHSFEGHRLLFGTLGGILPLPTHTNHGYGYLGRSSSARREGRSMETFLV